LAETIFFDPYLTHDEEAFDSANTENPIRVARVSKSEGEIHLAHQLISKIQAQY
jgi:hypothetical protein